MNFLMGQKNKNRLEEISNDLSWDQFWVNKGLQKLFAPTLCISAPSFNTFWLVLGESIFEQVIEHQMEKKEFLESRLKNIIFFGWLELIWPIKCWFSQDLLKSVEWWCRNAECWCRKLLEAFLNSKLTSW